MHQRHTAPMEARYRLLPIRLKCDRRHSFLPISLLKAPRDNRSAPGGRHGKEIARICLRSGSCDGGFARDHNVGGFPKASERFGWASALETAARNASYGGLPLAEITVAAQCRRGSRFLGQIWGGLLHFRLQARVCVIRGIGCTELS